jgi:hypothetical protein
MVSPPLPLEQATHFNEIVDNDRQLLYTGIAQRKREKQCLFATVFSRFHLPRTASLSRSCILATPLNRRRILHINIEDVALTRSIISAGQLFDIEVLDHLVIGQQRFVSLKERGLAFR